MVGVVGVNLGFNSLLTLFGFCGGWGITFVVYLIPSAIGLGTAGADTPLFQRLFLAVSVLVVLVMALAFTYVTFVPVSDGTHKNHSRSTLADPMDAFDWGPAP